MRVSAEPTASINLYTTQDDVGAQSTYSGDYWPVAGQQAPPYHSSLLNWDGSFTGTLASEASTVIPNSSSGKSLFYIKTLRIEYLRIMNSPTRLLGKKPERAGH